MYPIHGAAANAANPCGTRLSALLDDMCGGRLLFGIDVWQ